VEGSAFGAELPDLVATAQNKTVRKTIVRDAMRREISLSLVVAGVVDDGGQRGDAARISRVLWVGSFGSKISPSAPVNVLIDTGEPIVNEPVL
jgi:hypothetical protein